MRIGTKSVLFGVHQFAIHPLLIAFGWWKAYGLRPVQIPHRRAIDAWAASDDPDKRRIGEHLVALTPVTTTNLLDPRLWLAFVVHDLGYLGKPNMDGPEGETHPELGAKIMRRLFGNAWGDFCLLHSRYYAKRLNRPVSPLCMADKLVFLIEPAWLYLPRAWATGELRDYMEQGRIRALRADDPSTGEERADLLSGNPWRWHRSVCSYMRRWVAEHHGGKADTWTPNRHAELVAGVDDPSRVVPGQVTL
jgi:hypothetical protein